MLGPSQRCSGCAGACGQDRFHADAAAQREEHAAAQRDHAHLRGGKVGRWALSGRVEGTHRPEAEQASASSPEMRWILAMKGLRFSGSLRHGEWWQQHSVACSNAWQAQGAGRRAAGLENHSSALTKHESPTARNGQRVREAEGSARRRRRHSTGGSRRSCKGKEGQSARVHRSAPPVRQHPIPSPSPYQHRRQLPSLNLCGAHRAAPQLGRQHIAMTVEQQTGRIGHTACRPPTPHCKPCQHLHASLVQPRAPRPTSAMWACRS